MNLRQKNKKLKKELETYKKMYKNRLRTANYIQAEDYEIYRTESSILFNEYELKYINEDTITRILANAMRDFICEHIVVHRYKDMNSLNGNVRCSAELKILVDKNKNTGY